MGDKFDQAAYMADFYKKKTTTKLLRLNYERDSDIIKQLELVDNVNGYIKRLIREDLKMNKVYAHYIADNGDEFDRIYCPMFDDEPPKGDPEVIHCIAEKSDEPIEHINYYTQDGEFLGTAGVHVHRKIGEATQLVYTSRKSKATTNDTIARTIYEEA